MDYIAVPKFDLFYWGGEKTFQNPYGSVTRIEHYKRMVPTTRCPEFLYCNFPKEEIKTTIPHSLLSLNYL